MECLECGREFRPQKKEQKYCSDACRMRAYRKRKKAGIKVGRRKKQPEQVTVNVSKHVNAELSKQDFDRMMTGSYEEHLRFALNMLRRALESEETPANSLAPITKEMLDVAKQLEGYEGAAGGELDLSALDEVTDEQYSPGNAQ